MAVGPIVFTAALQQHAQGCVVLACVWEGATASGDQCELRRLGTNAPLWAARTEATQTYLGANFGPAGLLCPQGLTVSLLSAGRLFVYLKEEV